MGQSTISPQQDLLPARLTEAAVAPVIAVTYSSVEFDELDPAIPWQHTLRAVVAGGGVPLAIDCATPQTKIDELIRLADGLIVLGGGDVDPTLYDGDASDALLSGVNQIRDLNELKAISAARELQRPVLAICRGFQLLNVAHGGQLVADIRRDRPGSAEHQAGILRLMEAHHQVALDPASKLAQWMLQQEQVWVNSQHHQGLLNVGEGLRATAQAPDGLVEAVESQDGLMVGVQWHPELLWEADHNAAALLSGFVDACRVAASCSWR